MKYEEIRTQVLNAILDATKMGLIHGTSGNIAVRDFKDNVIAITPSGLSKDGILCNVMPTPWIKVFYYDIEPYSEKKVRLRAHLAASERNLVFPKEQQNLVEAHLHANHVMTFEAYKAARQGR